MVPSRFDAWSQVATLAMSLGVPVVGSAVEGLPGVLGEGRGVLVPPDEPAVLTRAIDGILGGRLRTDLRAARRYALRFDSQTVAASYAADYRALCGFGPAADLPAAA